MEAGKQGRREGERDGGGMKEGVCGGRKREEGWEGRVGGKDWATHD